MPCTNEPPTPCGVSSQNHVRSAHSRAKHIGKMSARTKNCTSSLAQLAMRMTTISLIFSSDVEAHVQSQYFGMFGPKNTYLNTVRPRLVHRLAGTDVGSDALLRQVRKGNRGALTENNGGHRRGRRCRSKESHSGQNAMLTATAPKRKM